MSGQTNESKRERVCVFSHNEAQLSSSNETKFCVNVILMRLDLSV